MKITAPPDVFTGRFTQQEPIPEDAIAAAVAVMQSGRLHRYNTASGEIAEAASLETEFAAWQGSRFALALASGGQALQIALRAIGVRPGDKVLTNAFTLAPVPGAIAAVGATPVLVEIDADLCLDLGDLAAKAQATGARVLMLSHMRGHLCDMEAVMALAETHGLKVIEDCAHTMGARWNGRLSGSFGTAACFSTQTYKHLNSGEGGFLTSDDPDLMARATIMSGSYMLYERHGAGPDATHFATARLETPNMSARMDNLRAALLRPQLARIETALTGWRDRHDTVAKVLGGVASLHLPRALPGADRVGSTIQFRIPDLDAEGCRALVAVTAARGVELKWFGAAQPAGFTSAHGSWQYMPAQALPQTDAVLAQLFDMRLPLTFSLGDCALIGRIIGACVQQVLAGAQR